MIQRLRAPEAVGDGAAEAVATEIPDVAAREGARCDCGERYQKIILWPVVTVSILCAIAIRDGQTASRTSQHHPTNCIVLTLSNCFA